MNMLNELQNKEQAINYLLTLHEHWQDHPVLHTFTVEEMIQFHFIVEEFTLRSVREYGAE
ncbi:hypothetical protein [Caldalkalibacillus salinus]|uniref:hypothetical protein n=1 Tax=Caldalkalibacillus salinus TaxID=2803787 RepID=UPI0019232529|nr:hypothetical protein [Caldalkalibacillus salinus]